MKKAVFTLFTVSLITLVLFLFLKSPAPKSKAETISFAPISYAATQQEKRSLLHTAQVRVNRHDESVSFTRLLATHTNENSEIFGLLKDYQDQPLFFEDGSPYICNGTNQGIGSGLDFTSILQRNNRLYMVSQFECQIGALYMAELKQNRESGALAVKKGTLQFISQKSEFGGYVHCAGSVTPWETHLGSEEYEPDAKTFETDRDDLTGVTGNIYIDELAKYWGNDMQKVSPYYYGWVPEVSIDETGKAHYTKHYAMGRFSHELAYVMPDQRTVYLSDDGTNVGFYMFKADQKGDLSSGTLYAAKWHQRDDRYGGSADLEWIELGHATDAEIRHFLDPDQNRSTNDSLTFSDIFAYEAVEENGSCSSEDFVSVNTATGAECLKVKEGMEQAAAFLETRRYAACKGATTEFRKEEGITFNPETRILYVAMSEIAKGMEDTQKSGTPDNSYDLGGGNHITLPYNPCGAVYALQLDKEYRALTMQAIITGKPTLEDKVNSCDIDGIANPDNLTYLKGSKRLFIGEDSARHENNVVWSFHTEESSLDRVVSVALGAETTSPYWYEDIHGFSYMMLVTQHPLADVEVTESEKESSVGVLGPIKLK